MPGNGNRRRFQSAVHVSAQVAESVVAAPSKSNAGQAAVTVGAPKGGLGEMKLRPHGAGRNQLQVVGQCARILFAVVVRAFHDASLNWATWYVQKCGLLLGAVSSYLYGAHRTATRIALLTRTKSVRVFLFRSFPCLAFSVYLLPFFAVREIH